MSKFFFSIDGINIRIITILIDSKNKEEKNSNEMNYSIVEKYYFKLKTDHMTLKLLFLSKNNSIERCVFLLKYF